MKLQLEEKPVEELTEMLNVNNAAINTGVLDFRAAYNRLANFLSANLIPIQEETPVKMEAVKKDYSKKGAKENVIN